MKKKKVRRIIFTRGEQLVYAGAMLAIVMTFVLQVFCSASIGNLNMSNEEIRYQIKQQEKKNESLAMKVSELTSFDNLKDIVKDMGLAYNNDNIVIVSD